MPFTQLCFFFFFQRLTFQVVIISDGVSASYVMYNYGQELMSFRSVLVSVIERTITTYLTYEQLVINKNLAY